MSEQKNADEIIQTLRRMAENSRSKHDVLVASADLLESQQARITELEAQLLESQRRERAAVEDFEGCMKNEKERCAYCIHDDECEPGESLCYANVCGFEWRGPQEAGEGETDG